MKKLILLLSFVPLRSYSQHLVRDEKDRFTGQSVKQSSEVNLKQGFSRKIHISARRIDSSLFLDVVRYDAVIFSVAKGQRLSFLMDDSSVVSAVCTMSEVATPYTTSGITTWSKTITYLVNASDWAKLSTCLVTDIRFYQPKGFDSFDNIKKGRAQEFKESIALVIK